MINHAFISFSAVQIYELSYIHLYSEDSKDTQSSQETDSSQEVTEHLNPWSGILDEAQERYEVQLNALVDEFERKGVSETVAHLKAQNALLRSSLQKRTEKSTVRASAVDASDEERLHLPKSDGNPKRSQRYRWL